jgi:hypothetical protein
MTPAAALGTMGFVEPVDVDREHEQVRASAVIELLDGSWLGVFGAEDVAARELETWALVPDGAPDETSRAGGVWAQALEAGPLLYVMFAGVVGNAAWSVFPAAARFLTRRRHADIDAGAVSLRVRATAKEALGAPAAADISIRDVHREGDGTWVAAFELASGETGSAHLTSDGAVVRLTCGPSRA